MIGAALRDAARGFSRGEIGMGEFFKRSEQDWRRIARWLFRKWKLPEGVDVEDVYGELCLQAIRAWERGFDPTRSSCPAKFVTHVAIDKTLTWMHGQRIGPGGKHGTPAKRASQIGIPASWLDHHDDGGASASWLDTVSGDSRSAEERAKAREQVEAIASLCTDGEVKVLEALLDADGNVEVGAAILYGNRDYRVDHWLTGDRSAYRHVEKILEGVRGKVEALVRIPVSGQATAG